jgi:hypothetical protein
MTAIDQHSSLLAFEFFFCKIGKKVQFLGENDLPEYTTNGMEWYDGKMSPRHSAQRHSAQWSHLYQFA